MEKVFISYSHDSEDHSKAVLALAQKLRLEGVQCEIDQFLSGGPAEGWPRWMQRRMEESDFVLVVCSTTYRRRFEGKELPGKGKGADWEGILVLQQLYEARSLNQKFIPVLLDGANESDIPSPLQPYTYYKLPGGYEGMYRYLTGQPKIIAHPLGTKRVLPSDP